MVAFPSCRLSPVPLRSDSLDPDRVSAGARASDRLQVRAEQPHHPHHVHAVLPEDGAELVVGDDLTLVGGILQAVRLDVVPHSFDDLGARQGLVADDRGEFERTGSGAATERPALRGFVTAFSVNMLIGSPFRLITASPTQAHALGEFGFLRQVVDGAAT